MHELQSWLEEKRSAFLYRIISDQESGTPRQLLFLELAREADNQAELWAHEVKKSGYGEPAHYTPEPGVRILAWLVGVMGPRKLRPILAAIGLRGLSVYSARYRMPASFDGASGLQAAVFDVNDGLISITCLVAGVSGGARESAVILLTGVAGMLVGACSMAIGAYISMRSQHEMYEYQAGARRRGLAYDTGQEAIELALVYHARGLPQDQAAALARRRIADAGADAPAAAEPGLDPGEPGSPWIAAVSSFFSFAAGGVIPLLPYLLDAHRHPLLISMALTALSLFGVGAVLSLLTGKDALWGGLRMLLIGGTAGTTAYLIGGYLGTRLG
ncbi:VIT family protein [mine drainage metagenome]|uniref:VIT family protein n=1 Tax=mine drainage metagenome TaxID=410659 RepID=A0A1J5R6W2_9ZZZZ